MDALPNPWQAAFVSALAFTMGAAIPLPRTPHCATHDHRLGGGGGQSVPIVEGLGQKGYGIKQT